jgi:hypothetical protein
VIEIALIHDDRRPARVLNWTGVWNGRVRSAESWGMRWWRKMDRREGLILIREAMEVIPLLLILLLFILGVFG